jgi:hypothetical protein
MDAFLVNITTPDFTAVVPPISSMPASKIIAMMRIEEPLGQFSAALDMLRECLSVDKVDDLDALTMEQAVAVVSVWVKEEASE